MRLGFRSLGLLTTTAIHATVTNPTPSTIHAEPHFRLSQQTYAERDSGKATTKSHIHPAKWRAFKKCSLGARTEGKATDQDLAPYDGLSVSANGSVLFGAALCSSCLVGDIVTYVVLMSLPFGALLCRCSCLPFLFGTSFGSDGSRLPCP